MKKEKKQNKEAVRRRFLKRMPKGGLVVEIGVWRGDFSGTLLEFLEPDCLVLIDPWEHIVEDSHSEALAARAGAEKMDRIHKRVSKAFAKEIKAGTVRIVRDYSVPALTEFEDESISFAYVDGDHSYEGVRADLEALFPKMKPGGLIGFDDYHRRGWWGDGVLAAVHEFIGSRPRNLRVRAVEGAQIAIEKIAPMPEAGEG